MDVTLVLQLLVLLQAEYVVLDQTSDVTKRLYLVCGKLQMLGQVHRAGLDLGGRVQATADTDLEPLDKVLQLGGLGLAVRDLLLQELQVPDFAIDLALRPILNSISVMPLRQRTDHDALCFNDGLWIYPLKQAVAAGEIQVLLHRLQCLLVREIDQGLDEHVEVSDGFCSLSRPIDS